MPLAPVTAVLITRERAWPSEARVDFPFESTVIEAQAPYVYRRFELAAQATTEHVYVQDDDCELDVDHLWQHYRRVDKGMLTNAITRGHQAMYAGTGVTLIGWGCFFPTAFAKLFVLHAAEWVRRFGEDVFKRECDRMFTWNFRPHQNVAMPIRQFRNAWALSNQPGHYQLRDRVIKELNA